MSRRRVVKEPSARFARVCPTCHTVLKSVLNRRLIRARLAELDWTQLEFAKRLGLSGPWVSRVLNPFRPLHLTPQHVRKIAQVLNLKAKDVILQDVVGPTRGQSIGAPPVLLSVAVEPVSPASPGASPAPESPIARLTPDDLGGLWTEVERQMDPQDLLLVPSPPAPETPGDASPPAS